MNAAFTKLEEVGLIEEVHEYAADHGLPSISPIFEYSQVRREVIAQVVCKDSPGRKAERIESLQEFLSVKPELQSDRAVKMLKACVDEVASKTESDVTDDAFFKAFPSLDPEKKPHLTLPKACTQTVPSWSLPFPFPAAEPISASKSACHTNGHKPRTAKPSIPPPSAAERPKRVLLD